MISISELFNVGYLEVISVLWLIDVFHIVDLLYEIDCEGLNNLFSCFNTSNAVQLCNSFLI